jgi:hypothetical protein
VIAKRVINLSQLNIYLSYPLHKDMEKDLLRPALLSQQ